MFLLVGCFLVFYSGLSLFLVVFLGLYSGFGGQELETVVKTEKHQNSILRDSLKNCDFFGFSWSGLGGLPLFLMVFLGLYSGFGGQELETTANSAKNHQNSMLRDNFKWCFFVFLGFSTMVLAFFCGCWCFLNFTAGLVVSTSKPL